MIAPDPTQVDAAAWEQARRSLPIIRRLAESDRMTQEDVYAAAAELGAGARISTLCFAVTVPTPA
ncbi:MAG: hypothetical protein QM605_09230 [Sphingobium sp.]